MPLLPGDVRLHHRGLLGPGGPRVGAVREAVLREDPQGAEARRRGVHAGRVRVAARGAHQGGAVYECRVELQVASDPPTARRE